MSPPREAPPMAVVQRRHSYRFIAIILLVLLILTALITIIIWLAVQPKKLQYSMEHGSVSAFNFTAGGHLTAAFHFVLRSENPNKRVSFYYDKIDVKLSYENTKLAVGKVDPFYQRRRNVTDLELNMAANDVAVVGAAAEHLKMERASGDLKLELKIGAKVRLKVGLTKVHRTAGVSCGPFAVPFSASKGFHRVLCDVDVSS